MRFLKISFCIFRRKGLHLQRFIPFLHTETAKTVYFFGIHGTSSHEESEEKNEQKTGVSLKRDDTILYIKVYRQKIVHAGHDMLAFTHN